MKAIGVFDSGVGGLTVVKELMRQLPNEDIIYFGDTARVPYGTKSKETIIRFSLENILFLLRQEVKLIVVACNTSSSIALTTLKRHFKIPIMGVISAGVKEAVYATKNKRVGVIATSATINSLAYTNEIKRIDSSISVFALACPLFVPLVEEGWLKQKIAFDIVLKYLKPLEEARVDTLILGCTHYPLLKSLIKKAMGRDVRLIDSAKLVAAEVKQVILEEGLSKAKSNGKPYYNFWVSDEPNKFKELAKRFLGYSLKNVRKIQSV
ncbi:MAG: glutamate racemase [Candidatus Omnitrophota bacterium]|nr:glutamate racemase [Candidatus Omnitrophota bacterium]